MSSYLSKTISKEYFEQKQQERGGSELYNAAGDRVNILNSFMEKTEKKRLDREAAKNKELYSIRTVEALMKAKLERHQKQRIEKSTMTDASRYAKVGDEFNMRREIENGYPVDGRDAVTGRTLIMEASVGGHYQCARVLCREFQCDCNITAFLGGVTALHLAVNGNFRQISVLLIQSGVDVNYQDRQGCTALHYVKSKTVLKVLLKADADPIVKNKHGKTPRQYYQDTVDVYDIDPFIIKTLREMEERVTKQKIQAELETIEKNKKEEEEKQKDLVKMRKKGKHV